MSLPRVSSFYCYRLTDSCKKLVKLEQGGRRYVRQLEQSSSTIRVTEKERLKWTTRRGKGTWQERQLRRIHEGRS